MTATVSAYWDNSERYKNHYDTAEKLGILLDDDTALCTPEVFDQLYTYDHSIPSGVYEGKVWKRHDDEGHYELCEYRAEEMPALHWPNFVKIIYRKLIVVWP